MLGDKTKSFQLKSDIVKSTMQEDLGVESQIRDKNSGAILSTASQIVNALEGNEHANANAIQLQVIVQDKDICLLMSSGLRISPGVPLPNQKFLLRRKHGKNNL